MLVKMANTHTHRTKLNQSWLSGRKVDSQLTGSVCMSERQTGEGWDGEGENMNLNEVPQPRNPSLISSLLVKSVHKLYNK